MLNIESEVRIEIQEKTANEVRAKLRMKRPRIVRDIVFGRYGLNSFRRQGWIARMRKDETQWYFQVKKQIAEDNWQEASAKVDAPKDYFQMLLLMGMRPIYMIERKRSEGHWHGCHLSLDHLRWVGYSLEFELTGRQDSKLLQTKVLEFCRPFKIQPRFLPPYGQMIKKKIKENKKICREMKMAIVSIINNV